MTKLFLGIYDFLKRHVAFRYVSLLVCFVAFAIIASKIHFAEDIASFLPQSVETDKVNYILDNVAISDKLILTIHQADTSKETDSELLNAASERFVEIVDSIVGENYIADIFYKVDQSAQMEVSSFIAENIPYFLEDSDYKRIDSILTADNIAATIENDKQLIVSPIGMVLKNNIIVDPLHIATPTLQKLQQFNVSDEYTSIDDYIFSKDGKEQVILITSVFPVSETAQNTILIDGIDKSIKQVSNEFHNDVSISYFGAAAVAVSNAHRIKKDSIISISLAAVLMVILFFCFFKRLSSILLLFVPIIFGVLFALALLAVFKSTISAIAVGIGSIILGIAMNYSLHFVVHTKYVKDSRSVLKDITFPLTIGSITTIGAFLSLLFISSGAMRDFGWFASLTLIGTTLFVLIYLPFLVGKKSCLNNNSTTIFDRYSNYKIHGNKIVVLVIICLTVILSFFASKTTFEGDMNAINYMTDEQRSNFNKISQVSTLSKTLVYNVSEGRTLDEALVNYESSQLLVDNMIKDGSISSVAGIGNFLPSKEMQAEKLKKWNDFWSSRKSQTISMVENASIATGFRTGTFSKFYDILNKQYDLVESSYFQVLIDNFMNDYMIIKDQKSMVITMLYVEPEQIESVVKTIPGFSFDSGTVMRSTIDSLSGDFDLIVYVCGIIVFVFLLLSFGRIELGLISFLPMFLSWIWILGLMAIFGIKFNIVNIILSSFIFGLGDDYTIFIMEGLVHEYSYKRKLVSTFKSAVILSALTMFIGIGSLIIAKHPAMRSLGEVTVVGMLSVVLMAFVIPPILFEWITKKKGQLRRIPITLKNLSVTIFCFIVFAIGSLIVTFIGFVLLTICGKTERHKLMYHKILCAIVRPLYTVLPMIKKKMINEYKETFEKPGIIICNHQSHLDLLIMMTLHPKIIILTNGWVWHSPFYGLLIRYADYYTISNGFDEFFPHIEKSFKNGYSIVIFPEGTRSEDCKIGRFHKGAFYLADLLKADIIPIVIHGVGHVLPKTEFLMRRGQFVVKILKRIPYGTINYKSISIAREYRHFYMDEYEKIVEEYEVADYFSDLVLHNYIYKGVEVERSVRKSLRINNNYKDQISKLPDEGTVTIDNCGYGEYPLLAALVKKKLNIIATDLDDEKILLAKNCVSVPKNLSYQLIKQ